MAVFSMATLKEKSGIQLQTWQIISIELENLMDVFPYLRHIRTCKRIRDFFNENKINAKVSYHTEKQRSEPYIKCELTCTLPDNCTYNIDNVCTLRLWLDTGRALDIVATRQEIYQAKEHYVKQIEILQRQMKYAEERVNEYLSLTKRINELHNLLPMVMNCDNIGNIEL